MMRDKCRGRYVGMVRTRFHNRNTNNECKDQVLVSVLALVSGWGSA